MQQREFKLLWNNREIGVKLYLTIFIFTASYNVGEIITCDQESRH